MCAYVLISLRPARVDRSGPTSPGSEASHYDAPWDMSQLHQLMSNTTPQNGGQVIRPKHVSSPHELSHPRPVERPAHPTDSGYRTAHRELYGPQQENNRFSPHPASPNSSSSSPSPPRPSV